MVRQEFAAHDLRQGRSTGWGRKRIYPGLGTGSPHFDKAKFTPRPAGEAAATVCTHRLPINVRAIDVLRIQWERQGLAAARRR
ncbi:hypothetical protein GCM10009801_13900 [Streptomyces albiaxialis]|uniref:Transposase n=1 Tax=Streptomyces albiaxialis TaxID=329523 RepID=A0ABN2VMZ5_9ACTN